MRARYLAASCIVIAAMVLTGAAGPAPVALPAGWRMLNDADRAEMRAEAERVYRGTGITFPQTYALRADFDGDGRVDQAVMLLNPAETKYGLFVLRRAERSYQLVHSGDSSFLWDISLYLERPRTFRTACAKGYGDEEGCRYSVQARWPAIGLSHNEASYQIFFWDGRRFDNEHLTD
jgi:hypothetical protein